MKLFLTTVFLFLSQNVLADGACKGLSKYIGTYNLVFKSCDAYPFGATLAVSPYDEARPPQYSGYWIISGSMGTGPTTSDSVNDLDHCSLEGNDVVVQICGNAKDDLCSLKSFSYRFSNDQVFFTTGLCSATFKK